MTPKPHPWTQAVVMQDVSERMSVWPWTIEVRRLLIPATLAAALGLLALGRSAVSTADGSHPPAPPLVVDLNTAPAALFSALPGIGPKTAAQIVEARRERRFTSLDDLDRRIKGIGPATMARLAPHLRVDPPRGKIDPRVVRARGLD